MPVNTAHEEDRYAWAIETARRLRAGETVDAVAIAEEMEQSARSDAHELNRRITQILEHLLKLHLVRGMALDYNSRGWKASIVRQRGEIQMLLSESPSLRRKITDESVAECCRNAARVVETEYEVMAPEACPFSSAAILGE